MEKNKDLFHDDFTLCLEAKCEEHHYDSLGNINTTSQWEDKDILENLSDDRDVIGSVRNLFEPFCILRHVCQTCDKRFKFKLFLARHKDRKIACSKDNNNTYCSLCEKHFRHHAGSKTFKKSSCKENVCLLFL